ncbi:hypothetical protein Mgra_00010218 [Meloidogyne graminicola]|uniref:Uncharacterized protein n=1 Tax=Meloidogyne graminicola TaxID=189291 RepID=A0A8S9ZA29_9BILA|nr:hypothetical protein Mgra_00010218 [Meloidogyne graminicola]
MADAYIPVPFGPCGCGLAGCVCSPVDEKQLSCKCQNGEKCLLCTWATKIYLEPPPDYQVEPEIVLISVGMGPEILE